MRMTAIIFLFCVLGLSSADVRAQIRILPKERLEAVDSPKLSGDSAALKLDIRHIKAELKEDDAPESFCCMITNVGTEQMCFSKISTTCSCVSAFAGQNVLKPGESTKLTVRYNPKGHIGRFEHKVFIYTKPGTDPSAVLRLNVEVEGSSDISGIYQVRMGNIALRSTDVRFSIDSKGIEVLKFVNMSGRDMKLECENMFLPDCITFETHPEILKDGQEGEIRIWYDPSKGKPDGRIPLILRNLGVSPSRSTININFE